MAENKDSSPLAQAEKRITITLTDSEVNEIFAIFDVACKAGGIRVAQAVVKYADKMMAELKTAIVPATTLPPNAIELKTR